MHLSCMQYFDHTKLIRISLDISATFKIHNMFQTMHSIPYYKPRVNDIAYNKMTSLTSYIYLLELTCF